MFLLNVLPCEVPESCRSHPEVTSDPEALEEDIRRPLQHPQFLEILAERCRIYLLERSISFVWRQHLVLVVVVEVSRRTVPGFLVARVIVWRRAGMILFVLVGGILIVAVFWAAVGEWFLWRAFYRSSFAVSVKKEKKWSIGISYSKNLKNIWMKWLTNQFICYDMEKSLQIFVSFIEKIKRLSAGETYLQAYTLVSGKCR